MPECTDQFEIYDFYARGDRHAEAIRYLNDYIVFYNIDFVEFSSLSLGKSKHDPPAADAGLLRKMQHQHRGKNLPLCTVL